MYLISSRPDANGDGNEENTVESCQLNTYPGSDKIYTGSSDITDSFLQSLIGEWWGVLRKEGMSDAGNAKAVAYLMDQYVWDEYKDSEENASYAIGGPTLELFKNSYNNSEETSNEIEITICQKSGYYTNASLGWLSTDYNNGIYNNNTRWWLASPLYANSYYVFFVDGSFGNLSGISVSMNYGLRPIVIIPKSKFQYKIMEE